MQRSDEKSAGSGGYAFRPVAAADLALLRGWLATPEVARWWGDPAREATLLEQDLDEPQMAMDIVSFRDRPFAYAQNYPVHAWPQPHLAHLPEGSRAVDVFIGEPAMIGRGHGGVFLRLLAERLVTGGAPVVAIDPAQENVRARRAFARAGFVAEGVVETGEGPAVLMLFRAPIESDGQPGLGTGPLSMYHSARTT